MTELCGGIRCIYVCNYLFDKRKNKYCQIQMIVLGLLLFIRYKKNKTSYV